MREIKFRAWDKNDKRMIIDEQDFIPLKVTNKGILRLSPHHEENLWSVVNEDRFVIMQYTGLKDRNGNEIYEGDIVKAFNETYDNTPSSNKVIFSNGCFRLSSNDKYISDIPLGNYKAKKIEVIGNIFNNRDLER